MRVAIEYSMYGEQASILRVIRLRRLNGGISEAIAILCFIAEFPSYFRKDSAQMVFNQACSTSYYPSTEDLELLMDHPRLLVAMIKYRESTLNPAGAVWNPKPTPPPSSPCITTEKVITPMDEWLCDELVALGLGK